MLKKQKLDNFASAIKDLCFPPACLICGSLLKESGILACAGCLQKLSFCLSPLCLQCGKSFKSREGEDHLCSSCVREKRFYYKARSLFVYNRHSAPLIRDFKYGGCTAGLKTFARWREEKGIGADLSLPRLIVPVPLHRRRLRQRGFNQALLLARAFFPEKKHIIDPFILRRKKDTVPQTSLSGGKRRRNLREAFLVEKKEKLAGRNVLLIDDVFTTGTTVDECARVLSRAGAARIEVITLARVQE